MEKPTMEKERKLFYDCMDAAEMPWVKGSTSENYMFSAWKNKTIKAKERRVAIEKYCEEIRVSIKREKDCLNLEWENDMLIDYCTDALNQDPPIPWEGPNDYTKTDQCVEMIAKICSEIYEVEVDPKSLFDK